MAITYVRDIVDFDQFKGSGGGDDKSKLNSSAVADEYNVERNLKYNYGDIVSYDGNIYSANRNIYPKPGAFDPTMWTEIPDYDPEVIYDTMTALVVYDGYVYTPKEVPLTGEFDITKWTNVTDRFHEYDPVSGEYEDGGFIVSYVEYDEKYYHSNENYESTGGMGEFKASKWNAYEVIEKLKADIEGAKPKTKVIGSVTTDENGDIEIAGMDNMFPPAIIGCKIQKATLVLPIPELHISWYVKADKWYLHFEDADGPIVSTNLGTSHNVNALTVYYI